MKETKKPNKRTNDVKMKLKMHSVRIHSRNGSIHNRPFEELTRRKRTFILGNKLHKLKRKNITHTNTPTIATPEKQTNAF